METHQATAFYTVISLIIVFVSFIIYVCWKLLVSIARAEGTYGVRPVPQRIEHSENIHPRRDDTMFLARPIDLNFQKPD